MFAGVVLQPGEADAIRTRTRLNTDETYLLQGCSALGADCKCAVYEHRPQICRRFRCSVLRALETNECTEADAQEAITEVLALRSELAARLKLAPREVLPHIRSTRGATVPDDAKPTLEQLVRKLALLQL
jgi:hypothetical protein